MSHSRALRAVDIAVDTAVGIALMGELIVVILNVLGRHFLELPILWADEGAGLALSIIAFLGGAIAYRREQHIFVRTFVDLLPPRWRDVLYALVDWLVLEIAAIAFYYSILLIRARWGETTPILEISGSWMAVPMFFGMVALAFYAAMRLAERLRDSIVLSLIATVFLTAAVVIAHYLFPEVPTNAAITFAIIVVLAGVLAGMPVAFALMLGTMLFLYLGGLIRMIAVTQNMVDGVGRFVLLALPFFIFAGFVMEQGGISRRLIVFVAALVGRLKGGLLQVMVISMYLVSGISGSKTADVAAVGLVMRDMLEEEGYDSSEAAAVLAASAAMGETVPPSLGILVLGSISSLSTGALFAAGLVPAATIALCLMILIYLRAARYPVKVRATVSPAAMIRLAGRAIIPFSVPAMLLAGIITGFATPTEVSAFAVAYGLLIAVLVYREISFKSMGQMIAAASTVSGMVLFTIAAAQTFSWALAAAQLPHGLAVIVTDMQDSPILFMLSSIVLLIALGSLLEGLPAILILAPLLLPFAPQLGISPLHYGIVLLVAMGIGAFLPPLGVGFYIACSVARAPMDSASRIMVPYTVMLLIGILVVAFVPWLTLVLPHALGFVD